MTKKPSAKQKPKTKKPAAKPKAKGGMKRSAKGTIAGGMTRAKDANGNDVILLASGNPQIAKGDGPAPVKAYLAAMPGWTRAVGTRIDRLVETAIPVVARAVKYNSPLYGIADNGWFLSMHVFQRFVRLAFLRGVLLTPMPPGTSKTKEARYLDIYENDAIDEAQFLAWIRQAAQHPGEKL
jgi:hypothetical protein